MVSFKNLKGVEGIDTLNECAPLVDEIFGDAEIFNDNTEMTFGELATPVYKKHTDAVNRLFELLGEKPDNAAAILSSVTRLLVEISSDKDVMSFFLGTVKSLRRWISATANIKGAQSGDSSNM